MLETLWEISYQHNGFTATEFFILQQRFVAKINLLRWHHQLSDLKTGWRGLQTSVQGRKGSPLACRNLQKKRSKFLRILHKQPNTI